MYRTHLSTNTTRRNPILAVVAILATTLAPWIASAQVPGGFQPLSLNGKVEQTAPVVTAKGIITPAVGGKPGLISITATMSPGWHIYSNTQPPGGPIRTKIKIPPSADYKVGEFTVVEAPHSAPEPAFDNLVVETHDGAVTWTASIELSPGVDPAKLSIAGSVYAQACENVCLPPQDYAFTATTVGGAGPQPSGSLAPPTPPTSTLPATSTLPPTSTLPVTSTITGPANPVGGPPIPNSFAPPTPGSGGLPKGLAAFTQPAAGGAGSAELYKPDLSHLTLSGTLTVEGATAMLALRAESEPEWHVYQTDTIIPKLGNQPTLIVFRDTSGLAIGQPTADQQPIPAHKAGELPYFEKPVTWTSPITIPADIKPGNYLITGSIGFQTCKSDAQCDRPSAAKFEATLTIGGTAGVSKVRFTEPDNYRALAKMVEASASTVVPPTTGPNVAVPAAAASNTADPLANIQVRTDEEKSSLSYMLMIAFFAGFILNFMPCVLPVIGLKVLSFVEQSGHDRGKILKLNIWYALGMLTVFWVLAAIPVVFKTSFGWGQQFSYDGFTITLVAIVFAMALSFLGVWEIPIPGFAGSGKAQKLAAKEGVSGAYVKGIITTLLATPCSGPGLAAAVGFAFRESAPVAFAIFTAMGLGMASPYLLIGFQPSLLRFLPKPGEWMDTFKQVMGFVLLGTVVWLMSSLPFGRLVPTVTLMFGLWAACWWIGRTPVYAEPAQKIKAWVGAVAWSAVIGWFAFGTLQGIIDYRLQRFVDAQIAAVMDPTKKPPQGPEHAGADAINWQHLSLPQLQTAFASNQTVLVDFTADWCATCKLLKGLYLDKPETKKLVDELGVVTFEADMTSPPQELTDLLRKLNPSGGVPVIAIFPAGDPSRPIVFADGYTQTQIFDALKKAGPSKAKTAEAVKPAIETKPMAEPKQAAIDVLDWKFMTVSRLRAELTDRKTVLVEFTADNCLNCKIVKRNCLNQAETRKLVDDLGVVAFEADMTRPPEEMRELLGKLSAAKGLPVLAIFPASDPSKPLVIEGLYTKQTLLDLLTKAGPSLTKTNGPAVGLR